MTQINQNFIVYEHPLNERMRTLLRLENLFNEMDTCASGETAMNAHHTIRVIDQILSLLERMDIKKELCHKLDRHNALLQRIASDHTQTVVDPKRLQEILAAIQYAYRQLNDLAGTRIGQVIREDELLSSVRQRLAIPGGCCSFDLPAYYHWLMQPYETRKVRLNSWTQHFAPIAEVLRLVLKLTRQSAKPETMVADNGLYQMFLEPQANCELVRVFMPTHSPCYPEISGSKHRAHIRFFSFQGAERPTPVYEDITFQLVCCVL